MIDRIISLGDTSVIGRVKLRKADTGQGLTGLSSASSGLIISSICDNEASAVSYTVAGSTIETITTLGTFAAPTATKIRFKEVDATNHPGTYEFHIADARLAVAGSKVLRISFLGATNLLEKEYKILINVPVSIWSILGTILTEGAAGRIAAAVIKFFNVASPTGTINSLPDAVPGAANALPIIDATGAKLTKTVDLTAGQTIAANLTQILGTALTETAGYLAAGFKKFFNIATPVATVASVDQGADNNVILASGSKGLAKVYDDMAKDATVSKPGTAQTITPPADYARRTGDYSTYAGGDTSGVTELLTRIPDATAGASGGLAIVGSKMDLVDAPNATAVTAIKTKLEEDGGKIDLILEEVTGLPKYRMLII